MILLAQKYLITPANTELLLVLIILLGAIIGSKVGAEMVKKINTGYLKLLFSAFLLFVALRMLKIISFAGIEQVVEPEFLLPAGIITGIIGGMASSFFGIGGGTIYVPFLTIFFGLPIHSAVATSIASITGTTFFGAFFHKKIKNMDFETAKIIIPAGLIGAVTGAITTTIVSAPNLEIFFGIFMVIIAGMLIRNYYREKKDK